VFGARTRGALASRLVEVAGWSTATRDDGLVARTVAETRAVDRVYTLGESAFFDELFAYLREIGVFTLLEDLTPQDGRRRSYPFLASVLITMMRCIGGVESQLATHDLLLTDEGLMSLVGFNATQVQGGASKRGLSQRKRPVAIRGAISYETVADNIVRIGKDKLAAMLNGIVSALAAQGQLDKVIDVVLDGTDDEATPKYKTDDGRPVPSVLREKRPSVRANGHAPKVKVTVWGWKIWAVWEPSAKLPLAIVIDDINVHDNKHALSVLQQAKRNVSPHARIRSVALDRGFLDGKLLGAIGREGMLIYIPARSDMTIAKDARALARLAKQEAAKGRPVDNCTVARRDHERKRGAGKNATTQTRLTEVVHIRDLHCDWWEHGSSSKRHSKHFEPQCVHATVVLCWDGARAEVDEEVVLLSTDPDKDPFAAFDAYDERSKIENTCNREAKERWFLEHHPKRSEAGMRVHAYFVFASMALVTGFRAHRAAADEQERRGQHTGIGRYRRALELQNRDKVAVFIDDRFGIYRSWELLLLLGVSVRERADMGESAATVLARYGAPSARRDSS